MEGIKRLKQFSLGGRRTDLLLLRRVKSNLIRLQTAMETVDISLACRMLAYCAFCSIRRPVNTSWLGAYTSLPILQKIM